MKTAVASWIVFWIYNVFIFQGAVLPAGKIPPWLAAVNDKLIHGAEYFILFFVSINAFRFSRFFLLREKTIRYGFYYCLFLGVVTELVQTLTPDRACDLRDWLADAAGAALALGIWAVWRRRKSAESS